MIAENAKALLAVLLSIATAIAVALEGDQTITTAEWIVVALAALGSGGVVWWVSKAQFAKAIVGAMSAALMALYVAIQDDNVVTNQEWAIAAVAALASLAAIYRVPNADSAETEDVVP